LAPSLLSFHYNYETFSGFGSCNLAFQGYLLNRAGS
jgi:hypothetical protein